MGIPQKRHDIESLFRLKLEILEEYKKFNEADQNTRKLLEQVRGHSKYSIRTYENGTTEEQNVDQSIWRYLVNLFNLERYMLCTEYDKLQKDIENNRTPVYTIENAYSWIESLKSIINENVIMMCKNVYNNIVNGTYWTGNVKKKRNNNGVNKKFILTTNDYNRVYGFCMTRPTITDDLEKVCYLLNGEILPENTLIDNARINRLEEVGNNYFSIRMYQNGNTHFTLTDDTVNKLNMIGSDGRVLGSDIKIKVF